MDSDSDEREEEEEQQQQQQQQEQQEEEDGGPVGRLSRRRRRVLEAALEARGAQPPLEARRDALGAPNGPAGALVLEGPRPRAAGARERLAEEGWERAVVVAVGAAGRAVRDLRRGLQGEADVFAAEELLCDPRAHAQGEGPTACAAIREELADAVVRWGPPEWYPRRLASDPLVRFLGLRPGDVLRYVRREETGPDVRLEIVVRDGD